MLFVVKITLSFLTLLESKASVIALAKLSISLIWPSSILSFGVLKEKALSIITLFLWYFPTIIFVFSLPISIEIAFLHITLLAFFLLPFLSFFFSEFFFLKALIISETSICNMLFFSLFSIAKTFPPLPL